MNKRLFPDSEKRMFVPFWAIDLPSSAARESLETGRVVDALPTHYGYHEKTPHAADAVEGATTMIDFAISTSAK